MILEDSLGDINRAIVCILTQFVLIFDDREIKKGENSNLNFDKIENYKFFKMFLFHSDMFFITKVHLRICQL